VAAIPDDSSVIQWFSRCVQLWSDTLGTPLDLADFIISGTDGERYVHLRPLKQYLQNWWDAADSLRDDWCVILAGLRAYIEHSQYFHHGKLSDHYYLFLNTVMEYITVSEPLRGLSRSKKSGQIVRHAQISNHMLVTR
jgi:hypothetical protein